MLLCFQGLNAEMRDSELIKLILQGDKEKFRILVEHYQQMVFRTCMGFLHDKDNADDLTQDIFIQAYQSLNSFKGKAAFSTWIYRIAVNASLNRVRKNSGNPILNRLDSLFGSGKEKEISLQAFDNENPESILIRQEHSKWVQNALDNLPENQRTAIVLSKYDDLSQKEIAEIMNTTEGAVEALIQRAKTNLRVKLSSSYKKNKKTP
jgi:RNA polymerase sigma-70 factor, ECF subfamily